MIMMGPILCGLVSLALPVVVRSACYTAMSRNFSYWRKKDEVAVERACLL